MEQALIAEVFQRIRTKLYLRFYYLFDAFQHIDFQLKEENGMILPQTDGKTLFFPEAYLLLFYVNDEPRLLYSIIHMLFHLIFLHHTQHILPEQFRIWSIACDLHAYLVLNKIPETNTFHTQEQRDMLAEHFENMEQKSAVILFEELTFKNKRILDELEALFRIDNHDLWFNSSDPQSQYSSMSHPPSENQSLWQDIQSRLKYIVSNHFFSIGTLSSYLKQLLTIQPKKLDYQSFFMKFMRLKDVVQPNLDEFDYIYYSYGLHHLGNVALLEDYELSSKKTIHHLVIAIDTSGSTFFFKEIKTLLEQTYALLETVLYKGTPFELTLIQCDADITKVSHIRKKSELKSLFEEFQVTGGGGTSFVPVFDYIREHQLIIDGLLYFTDGYGIFPTVKPPYKTGFILTEAVPFDLPKWAYKHIIKGEKT